jgi:hypothetical protein
MTDREYGRLKKQIEEKAASQLQALEELRAMSQRKTRVRKPKAVKTVPVSA